MGRSDPLVSPLTDFSLDQTTQHETRIGERERERDEHHRSSGLSGAASGAEGARAHPLSQRSQGHSQLGCASPPLLPRCTVPLFIYRFLLIGMIVFQNLGFETVQSRSGRF